MPQQQGVDLGSLSKEQLIARLQIAYSENDRLRENNIHLHKMLESLREHGWATPRPQNVHINIRDFPMGGEAQGGPAARSELARKVQEANDRADHWRKKYMDLLDSTGRAR